MVANVVAVLLFAISFGLRVANRLSGLAVALSIIGVLVTSFSGWLGGEMVYVHGMGMASEQEKRDASTAGKRRIA